MRQKTYIRTCAPSEDSDQPAHSRSLIRIFPGHFLDSQLCKVSSCGQRLLKLDCVDTQAGLNPRWALMSKRTFSQVVAHMFSHSGCLCVMNKEFITMLCICSTLRGLMFLFMIRSVNASFCLYMVVFTPASWTFPSISRHSLHKHFIWITCGFLFKHSYDSPLHLTWILKLKLPPRLVLILFFYTTCQAKRGVSTYVHAR